MLTLSNGCSVLAVGAYTAKHFYRALVVGVLGEEILGDKFYDMSSGADKKRLESLDSQLGFGVGLA